MTIARERLPERRLSFTDTIEAYDREFTVSAGIDPSSGKIREVFLGGEKTGSTLEHIFQDAAVVISVALQYGITADTMARSIAREPAEIVRPEDIDRTDLPSAPATLIGATLDWIIATDAKLAETRRDLAGEVSHA